MKSFSGLNYEVRFLRNFSARSENVAEGSACHHFTCVFIVRDRKSSNEFHILKTFSNPTQMIGLNTKSL